MRSFLVSLWMMVCVQVGYAALPADQVLQQKLAHFQSMQAQFVQTIYKEDGSVLQTAQGSVAIQKPGKFRWEVLQGVRQLIVTDGHTVWIYDPDLEQVTLRRLSAVSDNTPALLLLQPEKHLTQSFKVAEQHDDVFELIPKDSDASFQKVLLRFAGDAVQEMQLFNALGQKTCVTFSKIQLNTPLAQHLFQFQPPKDADVIDEK